MSLIEPTDLTLEEAMHLTELQNGIVHLGDEIGPFMARDLIRDIEYAIARRPEGEGITLFINSPGGGITDALAIYDFIVSINPRNPIVGIVRGQASSAASMIVLQAVGRRVATLQARLHLHEPSNWSFGPIEASRIRDDAAEITRLEHVVLSILSHRVKKSVEDLRLELGRRETWMSAEEALEWGLIDEIGDGSA